MATNSSPEVSESPKVSIFRAVGRRKTAVARTRIFTGEGTIIVNNKPVSEYFSGQVARMSYQKPFEVTGTLGKLSASIKVEGSGMNGQLQSVVHGLSRAIALISEEYQRKLKAAGLLTRDSRAKERRKYGLAGKARKKKQSPKR